MRVMHKAVKEKLGSRRNQLILGSGLFLVLMTFSALFYVQGSVVGGSDNIISYCGTPDFFDQFNDQYGYTPNGECTGVEIDGYRIDTEKEDGYTSNSDWRWGCSGSVSVYKIKENGDLKEIRDTGDAKRDIEDIQVGDLTIEPLSQTSGLSFYNCEWVANTYEYDFNGNLSMDASVPADVSDMENIPVDIQLDSEYNNQITGDIKATFCTEGAFGLNRCISRSVETDIAPGSRAIETVQVAKQNVGDTIEVSASFNGVMEVDGWKRVNVDCDSDSRIERIEDCDGFPISISKELDDIRTIPPVEVQDIIGPETVSVGEEVTYTANVSNLEEVSPSLSWSNGESGESAVYSWNSTGTYTVELTIDDGISETTETINVEVEDNSLFGGVMEFFRGLWQALTFQG